MEEANMSKCRRVKGRIGPIRYDFNHVVTVVSAAFIWGIVVWCIIRPGPAKEELTDWMLWVTKCWTWLYIGNQDAWIVFIIVLYFSKYSKIKLGKPGDQPEYNDATYFTMLFAAGIGMGLFYYGVAEPMWHYEPGKPHGNRYWGRISDNQRAQDAINQTFFHWGIHGWVVYVLVGLLLSYLSYNKGLPMTMRACFYPLIGDKVYGILGDIVDILSIIATMFGVCTSLGIGAIGFAGGLARLNRNIENNFQTQIIVIWGITAMATISVVTGMKVGIRRLSEICFAIGMFIMLVVFFYDDTWYLLNVFVQSIGYYFQNLIQLGFHTDAFAQLGIAPDSKEAPGWMLEWTILYWGWWIAWCPFVGMFIAKISKGRTIKDFIQNTLAVPATYTFLWFSIMGAAGIKMERNAVLAGITCNSTLGGAKAVESFNGLYRLSCRDNIDMWFDMITQYGKSDEFKQFMSVVSMVAILLYFVTSSDSGSLVIDCLAANGHQEPPVVQRIFWAFTEGACASILLRAGGTDALKALQSMAIVAGLMYTVVLNLMCVAIWRAFQMDFGELDPEKHKFSSNVLDSLFHPSKKRAKKLITAIIAPWFPLGKVAAKVYGGRACGYMIFLAIPFYLCFILQILQIVEEGLAYVGWAILFAFVGYGTGIRANMRAKYDIHGNMAEDFFAVLLMYPLAAVQMEEHLQIDAMHSNGDAELQSLTGGNGDKGKDTKGLTLHQSTI